MYGFKEMEGAIDRCIEMERNHPNALWDISDHHFTQSVRNGENGGWDIGTRQCTNMSEKCFATWADIECIFEPLSLSRNNTFISI